MSVPTYYLSLCLSGLDAHSCCPVLMEFLDGLTDYLFRGTVFISPSACCLHVDNRLNARVRPNSAMATLYVSCWLVCSHLSDSCIACEHRGQSNTLLNSSVVP